MAAALFGAQLFMKNIFTYQGITKLKI